MSLRIINRIAKTELAALFYSPVAWLLLVVFAVHVGVDLGVIVGEIVKIKALNGSFSFSATAGVVLGNMGLFEVIQDSIYLYIPLLTMNLMSREYASGSDKLLYSSPVSSLEIVAGKYLSMLACTLMLVAILALPALVLTAYAPHPDYSLFAAGLLAMFLLIATYCAVGLFMSSLTQYQVVAAVSTLAVLAFFNFVGEIGQNSVAIREFTYWLSIKGRASEMLGGLITSSDIAYFIAVGLFFITLTVLKLDDQRISRSGASKAMRYFMLAAVLVLVAFISSRPSMRLFHDATHNKARTLSEASQEVMKQLGGPMTITTYVDVQDPEFSDFIPSGQLKDRDRFKLYTRFKPDIKFRYVYYYSPIVDTAVLNRYPGMDQADIAREIAVGKGYKKPVLCSAGSLAEKIDLKAEKYQFVRVVERGSGEQARLRLYNDMHHHPDEAEISAAMKKMIADPVKIAAVMGHGERSMRRPGDRNYSVFATDGQFRYSMVNQGFDVVDIDLSRDAIPDDVSILMLADTRKEIPADEMEVIDSFLERGGNMMLVTDVGRSGFISPILSRLGLRMGAETDLSDVVYAYGTAEAAESLGGMYKKMQRRPGAMAVEMEGVAAFEAVDTLVYRKTPLLVSDTTGGRRPLCLACALTRDIPGDADSSTVHQQRIIVVGDADCYSNSKLQLTGLRSKIQLCNFSMLPNSFKWLCYDAFPVSSPRPAVRDNDFTLSPKYLPAVKRVYTLLIPFLIGLAGVVILYRRRRR